MAEVLRYSNAVDYETLEKACEFKCEKCKDFKPLRTHHCSVCDKCVLLMDHHCMWTDSCIGINNYKYFMQLNLYGMLGCMYTAFTINLC
jgi:palmitoyltransferase